ncbi:MAG: hypothetical protein LBP59_06270 [Planctomycetaceae bacterium]|jgi:very-short-patch-repair endonuclease|nr:hypothetical protein [Planctomycetaceae bacterium]
MIPINFIISQRIKYIYFIRYELLKFNNRFIRIATQKIVHTIRQTLNEILELSE